MSRIAIPARDEAPACSESMPDAIEKQFGFVPNLFSIMSLSPSALMGWVGLQGALAKTLDIKTREGIALAVSQVNSCQYSLSAHTFTAKNITKLCAEEILRNRHATSSDLKTEAALKFAKKAVETRGHVTEADLVAVQEAGYDEENIVEIIALSTQFLLTNFLTNVFDTPIDFPVVSLDPISA
ncbi:carboxymuconolactone decarboxylase family protein [Burkholderia sp. Ac-20365]|uniref:carboxymuconolactone decarboxylase family protein n=1 Tax=Burkholderia sp. Ac-20365 TaxID=2703897 RepID=UPI00197BAA79|nr:carboxymuconolactone decarboxylase family protein [Burkholderia sp. Ac-20365]MBN3759246.1 carboxymuconolactone decarboxylase family protein [Burkholderia sp. Ac-20365]